MSKPELVYFDFTGRAEPIRILFHIGGVEFTDTRFAKEEWPTVKASTPLGFVPVMKIDGTEYCQSVPLARYAAKLAGWYPTSELDALTCDMVVDSIAEITANAPRSKDPEEFKKLRQEFQTGAMTKYWKWIEGIIQSNGGTLVTGTTPTFADLFVAEMVPSIRSGFWDHIDTNFFDDYPGVLATMKAVHENDKIKAYKASKK